MIAIQRKNHSHIILGFICFLGLGLAFFAQPVYASSISSVTRLNLSRGSINGEKVDYTMYLPTFWTSYLMADRAKMTSTTGPLEKITFYYVPQETGAKPVFLMNFYVYEKRNYKDGNGTVRLLETEDFIFANDVSSATLKSQTDQALFNRFYQEASDAEYVASFIKPPADQKIIYKNTITVNNQRLKNATVTRDGGTVYLPIREVCERLGYKVGYLPAQNAVSVSKGSFYHLLLPEGAKGSYKVKYINGKAHAPTIFYIQILNVNLEIDENYNVTITD